jgi:hypothetical protein
VTPLMPCGLPWPWQVRHTANYPGLTYINVGVLSVCYLSSSARSLVTEDGHAFKQSGGAAVFQGKVTSSRHGKGCSGMLSGVFSGAGQHVIESLRAIRAGG